KLRPPADSPFGPAAGDSYQVTFSVPRVTVRGPRQLFQNEDSNRLLVEIPIIMPRPTEGDEEFTHRQPVSRIDWAASGLRSNRLDLARFVNDKSEWTAVEFAQDLKLVTKVRESAPTKDVEVVILVRDIHNKESGPTLKEFDVLSELIDNAAMERGKVTLPLKLPATLASNDAFMGQLALVLDIANATQNTAGDWSFPAFLAFRDGARHTDQRLLARIRFANTNRTVLTIELQKK
ncbi:MAG: hypothetical protein OER88_03375, partial [Planctomycetota bacterium]|nr:hypothetical protein [Planctomycetota bacterium]